MERRSIEQQLSDLGKATSGAGQTAQDAATQLQTAFDDVRDHGAWIALSRALRRLADNDGEPPQNET